MLEVPLVDDFYLSLIDWGKHDVVAIGMGTNVVGYHPPSNSFTSLVELAQHYERPSDVASVQWCDQLLSVGMYNGSVCVFDAAAERLVSTITPHCGRVGTSHWSEDQMLLVTGSKDRKVVVSDLRMGKGVLHMNSHKQEVCGTRWSCDGRVLASGGNDNKVMLWEPRKGSGSAMRIYTEHKAAVKALSWSPHHSHLLASGGGTADRCIKLWNTKHEDNSAIHTVDTGSQVCSMRWSKSSNQLVTAHGYSQNQIMVWDCPSLKPLATLNGHTMRPLYMTMSPCGSTVMTGAGDGSLRTWHVFPSIVNRLDNMTIAHKDIR